MWVDLAGLETKNTLMVSKWPNGQDQLEPCRVFSVLSCKELIRNSTSSFQNKAIKPESNRNFNQQPAETRLQAKQDFFSSPRLSASAGGTTSAPVPNCTAPSEATQL